MVFKLEVLDVIADADEGSVEAADVALELDVDVVVASVALLRCYRAGLVERWREPGRTGRHVYHYALTESGTMRRAWSRRWWR